MKSLLKEWFLHSKKERRGIVVLILILVAVILMRYFLPQAEFKEEELTELKKNLDKFHCQMASEEPKAVKSKSFNSYPKFSNKQAASYFIFDPNTIDSGSFVKLGFSPKQVSSILRYRLKAKFRSKNDFKKLYVVSESMFTKLEAYIRIAETIPHHTKQKDADTIKYIELNTADTSLLKQLRGIGGYYANKIHAYKKALGGFAFKEQLMEIKGIDSIRYQLFAHTVIIDTTHIRKLNINTLNEWELSRHPYVGKYLAKGIINYRNFKKKIQSTDQLIVDKIIDYKQAKRLDLYFVYE